MHFPLSGLLQCDKPRIGTADPHEPRGHGTDLGYPLGGPNDIIELSLSTPKLDQDNISNPLL